MTKININDIEVSSKLNDTINLAIKNGYKEKKYKKTRKCAAVIALIVLATAGINNGTVSAGITEMTNNIKEYFIKEIDRDFTEYEKVVGKTVTEKNISITLNQVIIDNGQLIFDTTLDFSKLSEDDGELYDNKKKYLNGEYINIDTKINGEYNNSGWWTSTNISDDVINNIYVINFDDIKDGNLNINVQYEFQYNDSFDGKYFNVEEVDGNWNFNFCIDENENSQNIKKLNLSDNNTIEFSNGDIINIVEVTKSDISIRIKYRDNITRNYSRASQIQVLEGDTILEKGHLYRDDDNEGVIQYFINDKNSNVFTIKDCISGQEIKLSFE